MSRTDAHAPFRLRLHRGDLAGRACHAAVHAVCDLPSTVPDPADWDATDCRWELQYTGIGACPCWMCHAGPQHRRDNRSERRDVRTTVALAHKIWRGGDESAFDDVVFVSPRQWW